MCLCVSTLRPHGVPHVLPIHISHCTGKSGKCRIQSLEIWVQVQALAVSHSVEGGRTHTNLLGFGLHTREMWLLLHVLGRVGVGKTWGHVCEGTWLLQKRSPVDYPSLPVWPCTCESTRHSTILYLLPSACSVKNTFGIPDLPLSGFEISSPQVDLCTNVWCNFAH